MILDFLKKYEHAINLDDKKYNGYFTSGMQRSDFLLFNNKIICEVKEFSNIDVLKKVENLARKPNLQPRSFKRRMYRRISDALRDANNQVGDTKVAMGLGDAYGLVILENVIPEDLSFLSLLDAADREMTSGLSNVDAVLCLDFVNTFIGPDKICPTFSACVSRLCKGTSYK